MSLEAELQQEGQRLPNLTHPDVPVGGEENAAVLKMVGGLGVGASVELYLHTCQRAAPRHEASIHIHARTWGLELCGCVPWLQVGSQRQFEFPVKDHVQLGEELDLIDFDNGALVGSTREGKGREGGRCYSSGGQAGMGGVWGQGKAVRAFGGRVGRMTRPQLDRPCTLETESETEVAGGPPGHFNVQVMESLESCMHSATNSAATSSHTLV